MELIFYLVLENENDFKFYIVRVFNVATIQLKTGDTEFPCLTKIPFKACQQLLLKTWKLIWKCCLVEFHQLTDLVQPFAFLSTHLITLIHRHLSTTTCFYSFTICFFTFASRFYPFPFVHQSFLSNFTRLPVVSTLSCSFTSLFYLFLLVYQLFLPICQLFRLPFVSRFSTQVK